MIYSKELLKATLETLNKYELVNMINMFADKQGNNDDQESGLAMTIDIIEEVLHEYEQDINEAREDNEQ